MHILFSKTPANWYNALSYSSYLKVAFLGGMVVGAHAFTFPQQIYECIWLGVLAFGPFFYLLLKRIDKIRSLPLDQEGKYDPKIKLVLFELARRKTAMFFEFVNSFCWGALIFSVVRLITEINIKVNDQANDVLFYSILIAALGCIVSKFILSGEAGKERLMWVRKKTKTAEDDILYIE